MEPTQFPVDPVVWLVLDKLCRHGMQYGAKALLPTVKGWTEIPERRCYLTLLLVKTEENSARRVRVAIRPSSELRWPENQLDEMLGLYEQKKLDLDKASNIEVLDNFEQTINVCRRMEVHMYMMYSTSQATSYSKICVLTTADR